MPTLPKTIKNKRIVDSSRKKRGEIYNNKKWKAIRDSYLLNNPLDEIDKAQGIITPAEDIHHVISFTSKEGEHLAFEYSNLAALSKKNHNKIHHDEEFRNKWTHYLLHGRNIIDDTIFTF